MQRDRGFYNELMIEVEQWLALPIGVACLAVFVWAALEGHKAFPLRHLSHLGSNALIAIGWLLTIAVGFLGVALIRFAFYKCSGLGTPTRSVTRKVKTANGGSAENAARSKLVVANKGSG